MLSFGKPRRSLRGPMEALTRHAGTGTPTPHTTRLLMTLRFSLLAALAVALGAAPAQAADCTSQGSGNFTEIAWSCGNVPGPNDTAIIGGGTTVTLDADVSVQGLVINGGGTFNNGAFTITSVKPNDSFLTNNGTFNGESGTFEFTQQGGVFGSNVVAFNNVTISAGVDFSAGSPQATVLGTFTIAAGGFVRDSGDGATPPAYLAGSTLSYDTGGTYGRGAEWTTAVTPANVSVASGTTLNLGTPGGTLSVSEGLTVAGTLSMGSMANPLDVDGDVSVPAGGALVLSTSIGGDLFAGGSVEVEGTFTANSRAVTFDGGGFGDPQDITGSVDFAFLTIDNSNGVRLRDDTAVTVSDALTYTSGQLFFTPFAFNTTFASSPPSGLTGTTTSATVTGDAGWRLLSVPASSLSSAELSNDGAATQLSPASNIYISWTGSMFTSPSSLPTTLIGGEGFFLYFFDNGNAGSQSLPITLDIDAPPPAPADDPVLDGFNVGAGNAGSNMIGNPFRNAFDVTRMVGLGGQAPQAAQIWNDGAGTDGSGTYVSTTTATISDVIPVWNGAFLDVPSGTGFDGVDLEGVILPDVSQVDGAGAFQSRRTPPSYVQLVLAGADARTGTPTRDEAAVAVFTASGRDGWDTRDMRKLVPMGASYATLAFVTDHDFGDGPTAQLMAQDSRGLEIDGRLSLPVHLDAVGTAPALTVEPVLSALPAGWGAVLEDRVTGVEHDLATGPYTFTAPAAARRGGPLAALTERATKADGDEPRFVLHVGPNAFATAAGDDAPTAEVTLADVYPNPATASARTSVTVASAQRVRAVLVDALGRTVRTVLDAEVPGGTAYSLDVDLGGLASGTYLLRVTGDSFATSRRLTVVR